MLPTAAPPPVGTLRFLQWKQQRDRDRRQQPMAEAAPPASTPATRRERRLPTHSEEEDELVGLLREREWRERVARATGESERDQRPGRRARRATAPATGESESKSESARRRPQRRPFGSAPRVEVAPQSSDLDALLGFRPAASSRWRSMRRQEDAGPEPLWLQEEAEADRLLEQAAKTDDGERRDLWDDFYVSSTRTSRQLSPLDSARASVERPASAGSRGLKDAASAIKEAGAESWSPNITDDVDRAIRRRRSSGSGLADGKQQERASELKPMVQERAEESVDARTPGSASAVSPTPSSSLSWAALVDQKRILRESLPPWSVRVLTGCIAIGLGGFFMEQLMEIVGIFSRSTPFTLSRAEQDRMHARLEGLQSELRGFRSAASEIDSHSQKVFQEVRHHLDRMRYERERHQDMVAKEMHELRRYILHMTYEMVEHEREVIHEKLKEMIGEKFAEETVSSQANESSTEIGDDDVTGSAHQDPIDDSMDITTDRQPRDPSKLDETRPLVTPPAEIKESTTGEDSPVRVDLVPTRVISKSDPIETYAAATVEPVYNPPAPIPISAKPSKPIKHSTAAAARGMLLMSWPLTVALTVMILFGAFISIRLRHKTRRNPRALQQRQRQERQRFFSPSRRSTSYEQKQEDGWESAGSEYSVETVALMTPVNSGGEEDEGEESEFRDGISETYDDDRSEFKSFASSYGSSEADDEDNMSEDDVHEPSSDDERRQEMVEEWDRMEDEEEDNQGDLDNQEQELTHRETVVDSPIVFRRESSPESDQAPVYRMATAEVGCSMSIGDG